MNTPSRIASLSATLFVVTSMIGSPAGAGQEAPAPRASQHGAVSQTVNATVLTIEYDRPAARSRELFGGIVDWGAVWTPGANRATWIDASSQVVLEGTVLAAGRYGIWMVPREAEPWEVVLVREWDTHHSYFPYESEALRVRVAPTAGEHMEALAFYFPVVGAYQTELRMHWGTTVLPLHIEVPR